MDIIVKGNGKKFISPDEIVLNITFTTKTESYDEALAKGTENVKRVLEEVLIPNGFSANDLKTRNFVVKKETKYNERSREYEFVGYSFNQYGSLKFDYSKEKLSKLMYELAQVKNPPMYYFNFGIKDKDSSRNEVLKVAFDDAKEQANGIAQAAGKTLKQCVKVDFQPFDQGYISKSGIDGAFGNVLERRVETAYSSDVRENISSTFTPEDVEIEETLYCLWIAE